MFRRFFHFAPPEVVDQVYQLGPKQTRVLLLGRYTAALTELLQVEFAHFRPWQPGRGVPIKWFMAHQQRHAQRQRMSCTSTMLEHSRRWACRGFHWLESPLPHLRRGRHLDPRMALYG